MDMHSYRSARKVELLHGLVWKVGIVAFCGKKKLFWCKLPIINQIVLLPYQFIDQHYLLTIAEVSRVQLQFHVLVCHWSYCLCLVHL